MEPFEKNNFEAKSMPDFRGQIDTLLDSEHPDVTISESARSLAAKLLSDIWHKYSDPSQPGYRAFHNHEHTLGVARRTLLILAMFRQAVPERVTDMDFELGLIMAMGHDTILEANDNQTAEERSADYTTNLMASASYSDDDKRRVYGGIIATTADFDQEGVHQNHVTEGSPDIAKLAVALADVNGILLEGKQRMLHDMVNLALESIPRSNLSINTVSESISRLAAMQRPFQNERRKDLPVFLKYYFTPEEIEQITKTYKAVYIRGNQQVDQSLQQLDASTIKIGEVITSLGASLPVAHEPATQIIIGGISKVFHRKSHNSGENIENNR